MIRTYQPDLSRETGPVFLAISRSIASDIRRGRLAPGTRLPGSRELASALSVHRNTVVAAYAELEQQGWVRSEVARGTFVSESLPEPKARRFAAAAPEAPIPLDLPDAVSPRAPRLAPGLLALAGGMPDTRLVPRAAIARAYRDALLRTPDRLPYGDYRGDPGLVRALRELLARTRGVVVAESELLVTRGSQMALHLVARAVCRPGDVIAVEAFGYAPAWQAFRLAGVELVPVPVDAHGVSIEALTRLTENQRIRAVYVTPHHQYPTTVALSAARRLALLELAQRRKFVVIEDDYDHEFHFKGRPLLPMASADPARLVAYVGTLSKVLAPGLRIGYLAARGEIVDRALALRSYIDVQGDHVVERAIAQLIEDGEFERHSRRTRRAYVERRATLFEAIAHHFGDDMTFTEPPGGLAVWARWQPAAAAPELCEQLAQRALQAGVYVQYARPLVFDGTALPYFRFGFPALAPPEIRRAIEILAREAGQLVPKVRARRRRSGKRLNSRA